MEEVVRYRREGDIAVITIDSPPVNAMGHAVRAGTCAAIDRFAADTAAKAAVLICAGRTFVAGADITEFGKPPKDPWLPEVVERIEDAPRIVIAAVHGTALGGGLEVAMGCHYRCAVPSARLGLPEVNLGLLPGATGTQRLPRLVGVKKALDMMVSGRPIPAADAHAAGLVDLIVEGDLEQGAIAWAKKLVAEGAPRRPVRELPVRGGDEATPDFLSHYLHEVPRTNGLFAPERIVRCVEAAVRLPYADALKVERQLFEECRESTESKALRHLFFAEREAAKVTDMPKDTPRREVKKVGVVGAGTMGGGIAMNFASAGIPVTVVETEQAALDRGLGIVRRNYDGAVDKGRMDAAQRDRCMQNIRGSLNYQDLADADLVIEAVFESMAVKKEVFTRLDKVCRPGAILASNTSTLDLDEIASVTGRPADVIGLHFFAPANVMPLLEIVRGRATAFDTLATALEVAKKIRKQGVVVGVCFGFVGNRMFLPYIREAQRMILEGTAPEHIDALAQDWGMAMGPNAVCDLSGLDVFQRLLDEWTERPADPAFCRVLGALHEAGRLGQKSGAGFYRYEGRNRRPDPEVMAIASREAERLGVARLELDNVEVMERLLYPLINEGARILEEGIAQRASDIDVIYTSGYGFPRWRGGPMFHADTIGPAKVYDGICAYRDRYGPEHWTPAPLLERLAREGGTFAAWKNQGRSPAGGEGPGA